MNAWTVIERRMNTHGDKFKENLVSSFLTYGSVCNYISHKYDSLGLDDSECSSEMVVSQIENGFKHIIWNFGNVEVDAREHEVREVCGDD